MPDARGTRIVLCEPGEPEALSSQRNLSVAGYRHGGEAKANIMRRAM